ncbi:hypothetical protein BFL35_11955 [Clavibacter michiganensis]|nr:hypothetical protein BFL35_11955 [Clavibacter michiganensis]
MQQHALGPGVGGHRDARRIGRVAEGAASAAVEVARHGDVAVVHGDDVRPLLRRGERQLHAEHARAEHDDAPSGPDGREHRARVPQVAERDDARGEGTPPVVERVGIPRGVAPRVPGRLEPVHGRHVRPGAGRQHEPVVRERLAGVQGRDPAHAVDRDHRVVPQHPHAGRLRRGRVGHLEALPVGAAHRVLGDEHAVVRVAVLRAHDDDREDPRPHRRQEALDEARGDGSVADDEHADHAVPRLSHAPPPRPSASRAHAPSRPCA